MIAIRGGRSEIVERLHSLLPPKEIVNIVARKADMPLDADRYLFCIGLLRAKKISEQTKDEITESMCANLWSVTDQIERIMSANAFARVCVIGSESALSGSYDGVYAEAKRRLHQYVENKRLATPYQQLVCIAPSIIGDCGMTTRRTDYRVLDQRMREHPKGRFLLAAEVARLVHFLLYVDEGYISGATIRMNGGWHTRR